MIEIDVIPLTANRQLRFKNFSDGRRFLLADGDANSGYRFDSYTGHSPFKNLGDDLGNRF